MAINNGKKKERKQNLTKVWHRFAQQEQVPAKQLNQFQRYVDLLREWNEKFNITTITHPISVIKYHLQDSLQIRKVVDIQKFSGLCDVGSGGGFPGLPLAICYPEMPIILIEVNNKKIQFLKTVINDLSLSLVEVYPLDWRTFLRNTTYNHNLFLARASLRPTELLRMFKPSCHYNRATLVYWATHMWNATDKERVFLQREVSYGVGQKKRKLVFFAKGT